MKVYVAGPMTGYPDWNFPAFEAATGELRDHGFEVVSPHELDEESGFDSSDEVQEDFDLREALERDVEAVLEADGVALLDGWEESPGAVIEVLTASSKGAPALPVAAMILKYAALVAIFVVLGAGVISGLCTFGDASEEIFTVVNATVPDVVDDGQAGEAVVDALCFQEQLGH